MKIHLLLFFQMVTVIVGLIVLFFLLWEPHLEGRNINATLFEIYFKDPFLAFVYIASVAFFIALYKTFNILGYIKDGSFFSQQTIRAVRTIRHCALSIIGFTIGAELYIFLIIRRKEDDIAGGVAIGLFIALVSFVVSVVSILIERRLLSKR